MDLMNWRWLRSRVARRLLLTIPALTVACGGGTDSGEGSAVRAADPRPNIVILFLDDAGYGDFGYTGNPVIRTPNIDRMAAEGTTFTQFYSASPACTASRYALLTGRLPVRSGFAWVLTPSSPRALALTIGTKPNICPTH